MRGLCSKQDYTGDVVPTKAEAGTQSRGNRWAPLEDASLDGWGGGQLLLPVLIHSLTQHLCISVGLLGR